MPPFAVEHGGVVVVCQPGPAHRFVVNEPRVRSVDVDEAALPSAQAEIEIVVDNSVRLVEAAERVESFAPGQKTGAGHRDHVALGQRQPEIAGIVFPAVAEGMTALAHRGEEHAGMLYSAIGKNVGCRNIPCLFVIMGAMTLTI